MKISLLDPIRQDKSTQLRATCFVLLLLYFMNAPNHSFAQKGKDGAYSNSTAATVILNRYATLSSGASSGASSITVSNIADLSGSTSFTNSVNPYATAALSVNDLVMIIQMQGADITTSDDASYGDITQYNGAGSYEVKTVYSIVGNTISFCDPLANSYGASGRQRTQVVRIPRLSSLTLGTYGTITAPAWDGTKGGICAIEVNGNATIDGQITVSGLGFRGGSFFSDATSTYGIANYRSTSTASGANKGESIVGNIADYASLGGAYCMGAPANGGGGGNSHNAGGGGGSNAGRNGVLTPWNGSGIKASGYTSSWNQEFVGFGSDISRGGGRGGYSYSANNGDATAQGPGNATAWGGDSRRNVGGLGGRPLNYNNDSRLFFGGGGGGGQDNNGTGSGGANGGGIVYLLVNGTVSGSGSINANGNTASNTSGADNDAPGGGGGGGAVMLMSSSTITGITINANGGNGGTQSITTAEGEGPGGGGGGGYIYTTTTSVTRNVNGGSNGTTTSTSLTEFPPNGATSGEAGTLVIGYYREVNQCYRQFNGINSPSCTPGTGSITASNTIINSYYPGSASVSAGANRISVGSRNTAGASTVISPGDLLLVIQMQGSTINSTNGSAYGSGGSSGNGYTATVAGTYEFVYAASNVISNTIYLTTPLKKSYTASAATGTSGQYSFQVVRVPEYASLTISAGASISVAEWNGSSGGIVAANVLGNISFGGGLGIHANALGFRGGGGRQLGGGSGSNSDYVTLSTNNANGSKGEGIAGTPRYVRTISNTLLDNTTEGYPSGSYGRGAPGNAGGGGTDGDPASNAQNTGGGGGSNGGAGGKGGAGWANPLSTLGGIGGAAISSSTIAANRLFMGGGGGAGTTNDGTGTPGAGFASSGGTGGGMIFLKAGSVSGTGTIEANGADGIAVNNDGSGGGGAGGSVYFFATNTSGLSSITINAKGGRGGDAWSSIADAGSTNDGNPEHGPGGGGGGGVIYTNGSIAAASSVAGGAHGVTTTSNLDYFSVDGSPGIKLTSSLNTFNVVKVYCDVDDDNDGIIDAVENPSGVEPFDDTDNDGIPNVYDILSGTSVGWTDANSDGINDNYDSDSDGKVDELDIDSDNDGITDNVEGQGTYSYVLPTDTDSDNDGLSDVYELAAQIGSYGGSGLTPVDTDSDGIPDYKDTDSDNDGVADRYEGVDRNYPSFLSQTQATINSSGDTDGDGLMDVFDGINNLSLTTNYYTNVTMGNMGPSGNFAGPSPSGSYQGLPKSNPTGGVDRDWRNASILPLNIVDVIVQYTDPIARIQWSVTNELNTDHYQVQFSRDGINFTTIQQQTANNNGTSNYSYTHQLNTIQANVLYYRILQIDKNGRQYYSKVVLVKLNKKIAVSVSPNPFTSYINVLINSSATETIQMQLMDKAGRVVKTFTKHIQRGQNSFQLTSMEALPAGTYHLNVNGINLQTSITVVKL